MTAISRGGLAGAGAFVAAVILAVLTMHTDAATAYSGSTFYSSSTSGSVLIDTSGGIATVPGTDVIDPFEPDLDVSTFRTYINANGWRFQVLRPGDTVAMYGSASVHDEQSVWHGQQLPGDDDSGWLLRPHTGAAWYVNANRIRYYRTFSLDGADLDSAAFSGAWAAGGPAYGLAAPVRMLLNGETISETSDLYPDSLVPFSAPGDAFLPGLNVVEVWFHLKEDGTHESSLASATLRVQGSVAASPIPLPAPLMLMAPPLAALGALRLTIARGP